jgi:hypothetical protein
VDDLLTSYNDGYSIRDHSLPPNHPKRDFRMRMILLKWIGDYQGQGKLANMKHSGGQACHWCRHKFRKGLGNAGSCFADNNRRYTPTNSPLRNDKNYGVDKPDAAENKPPKQRSHASIWATGWKITCGNLTPAEVLRLQKATGINGLCVLGLLYLFDLCWDIVLDMMHVVKNIWPEHLLKLFAGVGAPTKPTRLTENKKTIEQIREERLIHRDRLKLYAQVRSDYGVWVLNPKQRVEVDARGQLLHLANWMPPSLRIFSKSYKCVTYTRLTRSAAWQYLLGGFYPRGQQQALTSLIDLLAFMHHVDCDMLETPDHEERVKKMKELKTRVIITILLFEREFPKTLLLACLHNLLHIPDMIGRWNNVRNFWAFFMERMVGWLKNFVQTKARPAESLIKGYTIHMLARRAPTYLAEAFAVRRATYGAEMAKRGHLILASSMLAEQASKPGCGKLEVILSRRNKREYTYAQLPRAFKISFAAYNNAIPEIDRFTTRSEQLKFWSIEKGPAVTFNGRPFPMMVDTGMGIRYIYNGAPAYGRVLAVLYVFENDRKNALFVNVHPRELIEEKRTAATVRDHVARQPSIFIEAFTSITHIVKFVNHPSQPPGTYISLNIWATRTGWEINN